MTSSPKNKVLPSLPAHHVGLVLGLTAGLGLYALYRTPQGRSIQRHLQQTIDLLKQDLKEPLNSRSDATFQELTQLVDYLSQTPNKGSTPSPSSSLLSTLKSHFFAESPASINPAPLAPKTNKHHFKRTKTRQRHNRSL